MATIKRFEDLNVWQKARELDKTIFTLTRKTDFNRDFELKGQILAASGSIMDNIAEGFDREGTKEFAQFLSIAKASAGEVRSQSYRALDRNYINEADFTEVYEKALEIRNMISKLMDYLKTTEIQGLKYLKNS